MRPRLKVVFSWVLAAIGFFVGLCALTKFGMWWAPLGDHDQGWLLRWLIFVGIGLFGVGFLVGSLFAPRNPGRAGVIFLVFLAIYGVLPGLSGIAPQEAVAFVFAALTLIAALVCRRSRWTPVLVSHLAPYSSPFLLLGCSGECTTWSTAQRIYPEGGSSHLAVGPQGELAASFWQA